MPTEGPSDPVERRAWFNEVVYQVCLRHGGSEVSGLRSVARNAGVGGKPESRHLLALARDLVFDTEEGATKAFTEFYAKGLHGYRRDDKRYAHVQDRGAPAPKPAS